MRLLLAATAVFALTNCVSRSTPSLGPLESLQGSKSVTIYALHPSPHDPEGKPPSEALAFHGYRILEQASLAQGQITPLLSLVGTGISENDSMAAMCFNPRHGIRVQFSDYEVDFVICFECLQIYEYDSRKTERVTHLTSDRVEPEVSKIYQAHGLEIQGQ